MNKRRQRSEEIQIDNARQLSHLIVSIDIAVYEFIRMVGRGFFVPYIEDKKVLV